MGSSRLAEICSLITDGTHYTPPNVDFGVPFLTVKNINSQGALDFEGCSKISVDEYAKAVVGNSAPKNGDVLFSKDGTVGKVSVVSDRADFAVLSSIAILRPNAELVNSKYLGYALQSPDALDQALKKKTGSAIRRIILSDLKNVEIPLPPLPEQRRIVAILDKADALRAKRREAIAKLDQLLQSVFVNATAGQAGNSATIGELLESKFLLQHKDGNHGSQYPRKEEFGESGVPFLSARNLTDEGAIDLEDIQLLREDKANSLKIGWIVNGDVLLAHNASVGKVALYRGEFDRALVGTSLTVFRPDPEKLRPAFLFMALRADEFQRELTKDMSQTTRNQVPITAQRRLTIQVPEIDVQDKIVVAVEVLKKQKDALLAQSSEMERLFSALQQHAFAGKL